MKKKILRFTALLVVVFSVQQAAAWGLWAHKFITYTADKHLDADVRAKVERYLGSPMIDHATWMDEIRRPIYDKIKPGDSIDREFLASYRKISEGQAMRAAYRLAYILNETLK